MAILDAVLLLVRVVLGVTFVLHGSQKLFGTHGGSGLRGTQEMMVAIGVKQPKLMGTLATLSEFGGGLLVLIGLLTQFAAALVISTMIVAIITVHYKNGFFSQNRGYEFNLNLITSALVLVFLGAGSVSVDHFLGLAHPINEFPVWVIVVLILICFGGLITTEFFRLTHRSAKAS